MSDPDYLDVHKFPYKSLLSRLVLVHNQNNQPRLKVNIIRVSVRGSTYLKISFINLFRDSCLGSLSEPP